MAQTFEHGYALLIGVGETSYKPWTLPATVKDVQSLQNVLTDPTRCGFPADGGHIRVLTDKAATRAAILEGLAWLKGKAAADSEATCIVFYSGHGFLDQADGRYHLIPHDTEPLDVARSALAADDFAQGVRVVSARRLLVIIDSCHAQGMATSKDPIFRMKLPAGLAQTSPTEAKGLLTSLKQGEGRAVFTSCRGSQVSWICSDGLLSVFTHHFLEALQGAGSKPGESQVRLSHVMGHLGKAVPLSVRQMYSADQTPFFDVATEDFPIALLNGGKGLSDNGMGAIKPVVGEVVHQATTVIASGPRAVAINGGVTGTTIVTGDQVGVNSHST